MAYVILDFYTLKMLRKCHPNFSSFIIKFLHYQKYTKLQMSLHYPTDRNILLSVYIFSSPGLVACASSSSAASVTDELSP